jgi:hypothetical protein
VIGAILVSALNTVYITNNADYATQKYYRVASITTYLACAALYIFLYYHFQEGNETYLATTLMGILMLVCLPATIMSISVATIIAGND